MTTQYKTMTGFNNNGTINFEDFQKLLENENPECLDFTPQGATFMCFDIFDISNIKVSDLKSDNTAIRSESEFEDRVERLSIAFSVNGFATTKFPPCVDQDDNVLDGRGRIAAAIRNGEKRIPVARFYLQDQSSVNKHTIGLIANKSKFPKSDATSTDCFAYAKSLLLEGLSYKEVENKLKDEFQIYQQLGIRESKNVLQKIKKLAQGPGLSLVQHHTPNSANQWIKDNMGDIRYHLLNTSHETYPTRLWASILKEPNLKIIFYHTGGHGCSKEKIRKAHKDAEEQLNRYWSQTFEVVRSTVMKASNGYVKISKSEHCCPYEIAGALPQIFGEHDFKRPELIPLSEF